MRGITPRYSNVVVGMGIFPVDPGLVNEGKMKIQNSASLNNALSAVTPAETNVKAAPPIGWVLAIIGGVLVFNYAVVGTAVKKRN